MTRTCEECRAPATSKRNIGGVLEARCERCLRAAERQAREDERRAGWVVEEKPVQLELWAA